MWIKKLMVDITDIDLQNHYFRGFDAEVDGGFCDKIN